MAAVKTEIIITKMIINKPIPVGKGLTPGPTVMVDRQQSVTVFWGLCYYLRSSHHRILS